MVPKSKRVEEIGIQMIFETIMAFSLIDVNLKRDRKRPKIIIILNNFSIESKDVETLDRDESTTGV